MNEYQYKIQWLLSVSLIDDMEYALKVIEILGHRSFDMIYFRDEDLNIIGEFSTKSYSSSQEETVREELSQKILADNKIKYIELFKK